MAGSEIEKYNLKLPEIAGWERLKLIPGKIERIREIDRSFDNHASMAVRGAVGMAVDVYNMREELLVERGAYMDWVRTKFTKSPDNAQSILRTVEKAKKGGYDTDQLSLIGDSLIRNGAPTGYGLGEIVNTMLKLDPPNNSQPKTIDGYVVKKLMPTLTKGRTGRRKKPVKLSDESIIPMVFNSGRLIIGKLKQPTTAEVVHIIKTVGGMWMTHFLIPRQEIKVHRVAVPEGVIGQVGRPRKAE